MDYCSSLIFASFVLCCTGTSLEKSIQLLQYVCKLSFGKISYHLQTSQLVYRAHPSTGFYMMPVLTESFKEGVITMCALFQGLTEMALK